MHIRISTFFHTYNRLIFSRVFLLINILTIVITTTFKINLYTFVLLMFFKMAEDFSPYTAGTEKDKDLDGIIRPHAREAFAGQG